MTTEAADVDWLHAEGGPVENTVKALEEINLINEEMPCTTPIRKWKESGGKVVGWLCDYVPEEIIHAAGALPVRLTGVSKELSLDRGTAYLYVTTCSFVRTVMELWLRQEYEFLDGSVVAANCDQARRFSDIWGAYFPKFHYFISVPYKDDDDATRYFQKELEEFREVFGRAFGTEITSQSLAYSIALYNRTRELLSELNELRKADKPPITGAEALKVVNVASKMPREDFNQLLERLLGELKLSHRHIDKGPRLMISGSIIHNADFIKFVEDLGCTVVVSELCSDYRYGQGKVNPDLEPMEALAKRYLQKPIPCPRIVPAEKRWEKVVQLAKEYRVQGVISQMIRYCTPNAWERPWIKRYLEEAGFPVLQLEDMYGFPGNAQVKTRIQAFLEMLEEELEVSTL